MPITPDVKNWTWVLERACPECRYDAALVAPGDVSTIIRENAAVWTAVLDRADIRVRPNDSTWSPLEYAAHVRDVLRIAAMRLALMMGADDAVFADWNQDESAVAEQYNEQDPHTVQKQLLLAAAGLAGALDEVAAGSAPLDGVAAGWSRTGRRSDGAVFTVDTFARYVAHDIEHHRWDVRR